MVGVTIPEMLPDKTFETEGCKLVGIVGVEREGKGSNPDAIVVEELLPLRVNIELEGRAIVTPDTLEGS